MSREVMQQALEALEESEQHYGSDAALRDAIQSLRTALAEPEQKPVDKTTMELAESVGLIGPASRTHDLHGAIQRFHDLIVMNASIKAAQQFATTLQQRTEPEQDPVAYVTGTHGGDFVVVPLNPALVLTRGMALYIHPPQRKPLSDEEIDDIWNRYCDEMGEASINDAYDIARAIERAHGIKQEEA